ncbi:glucose-6-phosphate isomerase [Betaproteobacteria bacterium]|nr:glucose-6-phosphate isomerase [Betaproteobacteria bacterium]GHU41907.1 glucose-6-phosphate isomerase [Betaproteobacteria bacterium]
MLTPMTTEHAPADLALRALAAHAEDIKPEHLRALFAEHPSRFEDFSLVAGDILLDFSKQRITPETLKLLHALAKARDVEGWRRRMCAGEAINHTENRAALHMALREPLNLPHAAHAPEITREVAQNLTRMWEFCTAVHSGNWHSHGSKAHMTDVVNLGIGGSDLGPRMAVRALAAYQQPDLRVHFVSNMDSADLAPLLARLNPRSTLFIVASKTFGTLETLSNARMARDWIESSLPASLTGKNREDAIARHFVAVSSNLPAAAAFGIPAEQVFAFRDWVGGRFSLWSSVGLSIALAVGFHNFEALLAGAHVMDEHFIHAPAPQNLPLTLALLDIWNVNFIGAASHGIFPYSQSLELFPAYLQQLEMESTGKSVDRQGKPLTLKSCPILWGSSGTNGQHSFFQLLHQGGQPIPCDFILLKHADFPLPGYENHAHLLANGLAQSAALAFGQTAEEARASGIGEDLLPYRTFPGNQPSTTLLLERLTPHTLGQLLALFEHKVFCQSVLWNVNAFDQWGVELGKQMAKRLLPCLNNDPAHRADTLDASTRGLLAALKK